MPKTFAPADPKTRKLVADAFAESNPDLRKVRLAVVAVEADRPEPAAVACRIAGPVVRAAGAPDVVVLIDVQAWGGLDEAERLAWLDAVAAELRVRVRDGSIVSDCAGRPLVRRRRPDFAVKGFRDVAARRGAATPGVADALNLVDAVRAASGGKLARVGRSKAPASAFG